LKGGALRAARRRGAQARRGARRTLTWSAALPSWRDPEHVNVVGREGVRHPFRGAPPHPGVAHP